MDGRIDTPGHSDVKKHLSKHIRIPVFLDLMRNSAVLTRLTINIFNEM